MRKLACVCALLSTISTSGIASAHHEALFGPQSSLAVESTGFVSTQSFVHAYGTGDTRTEETTFIVSGGLSPIDGVPWSFAVVQPFTYQTTRAPTPPGTTGPFTACDACWRRENALVATQYRFDLTGLQRATGKDGNFALLSAALEPPTGNKDYATYHGPFNAIAAALVGFEWSSFAVVGLGYWRFDTRDDTSSKKGDNFLVGAGFAWTPIDEEDRMISFQLGVGEEVHFRDVDHARTIDASGGSELIVSPTFVFMPLRSLRIFSLVSLPLAESYRDDAQRDRYRLGLGLIYSYDRVVSPLVPPPPTQ